MTAVSTIEIEVAGRRLSGRTIEPDGAPRALVIALHGGSYSSAYYDLRSGDRSSALQNFADLGYRVIALDRPGYGAAADAGPVDCSFAAQADVLRTAIAQLHDGLPAFLMGHSIGGMIAMTVAAGLVDAPLSGVMASSMGMVWRPGILEMWSSLISDAPQVAVPNEARDQLMFVADLADPAVQREAGADLHPIPAEELRGAVTWHETMPAVAAEIRVPVLHVLPEHDGIWASDEHAQQQAAAALKGVDGATVVVQRGAGHSIDAHRAGWAHHLATAAFFETCAVTR